MTLIWNGDLETGDQLQWAGYADGKAHTDRTGLINSLTSSGRKWSSQALAQGWTARFPLNEISGTLASDVHGAHDGIYSGPLGSFTLNQAGNIAEAGTRSVLLNGSSGYIDLGANGLDLSSGSWGFFCLCKPSILDANHRGLFGGPNGSYCASLLNGLLNVGIVGGANLQISPSNRPASLNAWNAIGISYNATTDNLTHLIYSTGIPYQNVGPYSVSNTLTPTPSVKVNQIGKRDTGGFYQGNIQEALFIIGSELTEIMFLTLYDDARIKATDDSIIVLPDSGPTQKGMTRVDLHPPTSGIYDAAERYHQPHPNPVGVTEYLSMSLRIPSNSNFGTVFFPTSPEGWLAVAQLSYNGYTAGSFMVEICPNGFDGVGPFLRARIQGGLTVAGSAPDDINYINKTAGTGWNTHYPPSTTVAEVDKRFPQLLGPNTFLNPGLHPWEYDVWHEFIFKIKWSTNLGNGSTEVWHRVKGRGGSISSAAAKVYETFSRNNFQYAAGDNTLGFNTLYKFGGYLGRGTINLTYFEDQIAIATTFAEAEAEFVTESAPTARSGTASIHGGGRVTVNRNTTLVDFLGGSHNGTYYGGYTQGVAGFGGDNAVTFVGSPGFAEVPDDPELDLGNGPFTLITWIKRNVLGTLQYILDKGPNGYAMFLRTDNLIAFAPQGSSTNIVQSTVSFTDTADFHMIAVSYSGGSTASLYMDGVNRSSVVTPQTIIDNTNPLRIGQKVTGGGFLNATLDETVIAKSALNATTIQNLYNAGISQLQSFSGIALVTGGGILLTTATKDIAAPQVGGSVGGGTLTAVSQKNASGAMLIHGGGTLTGVGASVALGPYPGIRIRGGGTLQAATGGYPGIKVSGGGHFTAQGVASTPTGRVASISGGGGFSATGNMVGQSTPIISANAQLRAAYLAQRNSLVAMSGGGGFHVNTLAVQPPVPIIVPVPVEPPTHFKTGRLVAVKHLDHSGNALGET